MKRNKEWTDYLELIEKRNYAFKNHGKIDIVFDEDTVGKFEEETGLKIGVLYHSDYNILVVDLVRDETGSLYPYERLMPAVESGAVVTVPVFENKFVLIRQYRHALRDYQYAFVRGFGEIGLSYEENAKKELSEELAAETESCENIGEIVADSGISPSRAGVCLCRLKNYEVRNGYEGIESVLCLTENELSDMIAEGSINDGFTIAAFAMVKAKSEK